MRELRNFVESCLVLTKGPIIKLSSIPDHLLAEINRNSILPVPREMMKEQSERELIYRTLIELKNDLSEIRDLLRYNHAQQDSRDISRIMEVVPLPEGGETLEEMERQAVRNALKNAQGNRRKAAKMLGIGERTLYRKLKEKG